MHVLILAEGATSRLSDRDRDLCQTELSSLAASAQRAGEILGVSSSELCSFPDNRMDGCDLLDVVKVIESAVEKHCPSVIYTHHIGDVNVDHQQIHRAVVTACRPLPQHSVKTLLFFEVPSSSEWQTPGSAPSFMPNWYVDVSGTLDLKLQALQAYESELRPWPHPRSLKGVEHLARWRGASVSLPAAEAFVLGRHLS